MYLIDFFVLSINFIEFQLLALGQPPPPKLLLIIFLRKTAFYIFLFCGSYYPVNNLLQIFPEFFNIFRLHSATDGKFMSATSRIF